MLIWGRRRRQLFSVESPAHRAYLLTPGAPFVLVDHVLLICPWRARPRGELSLDQRARLDAVRGTLVAARRQGPLPDLAWVDREAVTPIRGVPDGWLARRLHDGERLRVTGL